MQAGPSLAIGGGDLGAQPVDEHAARTVLGEMKADRRTGHRLARLVRDFDGKRAGSSGARRMYRAFALDHLNLKDGDLSCRRAGKRDNKRCQPGKSYAQKKALRYPEGARADLPSLPY